MKRLALVTFALIFASAASAQQTTTKLGSMGQVIKPPVAGFPAAGTAAGESTMAELLTKGYDIKAAVPNGGKFIVFMQKDQSAYACEFESLTGTRCGSIN